MQKKKRVTPKGKTIYYYALLLVVTIIYLAFMIWLNQPPVGQAATAASKVIFAPARVTKVLEEAAQADTWTEGLRIGQQDIEVKVTAGKFKGESFRTLNYLSAYGNVDVKPGTSIIVRLDYNDQGTLYVSSVVNYNRSYVVYGLLGLFVLLLVGLGGRKGLASLGGLLFTVLNIWFLLIPLLQKGIPAIPATILLVAITTFVTLMALNGPSKKTYIAIAGCVGGVAISGLVAMAAGALTPMSGFNMPEAEELILRAWDTKLQVRGLLVSGILIAALGAVMDVAMTIASALNELSSLNPKISKQQLFKSGLNIGKDAMGTMADTLILAFAGASLNTLVLFKIFDYPYLQILNSDLMVIEIVQGLSGSIGIVLTVPLVAVIGAYLYGREVTR